MSFAEPCTPNYFAPNRTKMISSLALAVLRSDPDLSEAFSLFKHKMSLYLEDEEITDAAKQAMTICLGVGDEGLKRPNDRKLA